MTCSRDKDLFILRAGRGVNKENANLVEKGEKLVLKGQNYNDWLYHDNPHVPYNHWDEWKKRDQIRGYIHFGMTDKITSEIYNEKKEKIKSLKEDGVTEYRKWQKILYEVYQLEAFFEMSEKIGNNVIVIEPNTEEYRKMECKVHGTDKYGDPCCSLSKNVQPSSEMFSHFVFIGKTKSNIKNGQVNFGEYGSITLDDEDIGKLNNFRELGNHANYVELEGNIFNQPISTSREEYIKYFGTRKGKNAGIDHPINKNNQRFACYKFDKSKLEDKWGTIDTLYEQ